MTAGQGPATLQVLARFGEPVTVVTVVRVTDRYQDTTETRTEVAVARALFEPEQQQPRTDPGSPGVTSPARWYLPPGVPVSEDDVIRDGRGREWVVESVQEWPHGSVCGCKRWGTT